MHSFHTERETKTNLKECENFIFYNSLFLGNAWKHLLSAVHIVNVTPRVPTKDLVALQCNLFTLDPSEPTWVKCYGQDLCGWMSEYVYMHHLRCSAPYTNGFSTVCCRFLYFWLQKKRQVFSVCFFMTVVSETVLKTNVTFSSFKIKACH